MNLFDILFAAALSGGGGGGGDVTALAVAAAIGEMSAAQAAQALSDLGAAPELTVTAVSGATPSIEPAANHRYECGTLTSLTITNPPATGSYSIVFTSGATATVVSGVSGIMGLENLASEVEANAIYEINVLDNRAVYKGWPVT